MTGIDNFAHRSGYAADALGFAMRQARKGGTLAAGEGALLVAEIDRLTAATYALRKDITAVGFINKLANDAREQDAVTIEDTTYLADEFPTGFWRKLAKEVNYLHSQEVGA